MATAAGEEVKIIDPIHQFVIEKIIDLGPLSLHQFRPLGGHRRRLRDAALRARAEESDPHAAPIGGREHL